MLLLKLKKMLLMLYLINNFDMETLVIMNYNTGEIDIYTLALVDIDSVAGHVLCHLQGAMGCTTCQHEG